MKTILPPSLRELRLASPGALYVLETHDDIYLGTIKVVGEEVHVHNGFVGRPVVLHVSELVTFTPARVHPDVEVL